MTTSSSLGRRFVQRRAKLLLLDRGARAVDQRGERAGVANGDVGQQLRIRDAVQASRGVDAGDPEPAEITLAILAAGEGRVERLVHRLLGDAVTARLHPVVALGELQDLRAAVLTFWASFDAWHGLSSFFYSEPAGQGEPRLARCRT